MRSSKVRSPAAAFARWAPASSSATKAWTRAISSASTASATAVHAPKPASRATASTAALPALEPSLIAALTFSTVAMRRAGSRAQSPPAKASTRANTPARSSVKGRLFLSRRQRPGSTTVSCAAGSQASRSLWRASRTAPVASARGRAGGRMAVRS